MRKRYKDVEATMASLKKNIECNDAWAWARRPNTLDDLNEAEKELKEKMSPFASDFMTLKTAALKKKWDPSTATKESASLLELVEPVAKVEAELQNVVGMHGGRVDKKT